MKAIINSPSLNLPPVFLCDEHMSKELQREPLDAYEAVIETDADASHECCVCKAAGQGHYSYNENHSVE